MFAASLLVRVRSWRLLTAMVSFAGSLMPPQPETDPRFPLIVLLQAHFLEPPRGFER